MMRVKINHGDDYFTVQINDRVVPVDAIVVEIEEDGPGIVHLFSKDLKVDFVEEGSNVEVRHVSPDPRPMIADLVRNLPAGVVEAAALEELGMNSQSVVQNALGVIADLIIGMDLTGEEEDGDDQYECCDEDTGQPDAGQDFDFDTGGRGLFQ